MTKASDNAFPSILITEGTEPSAPAAGKQRLYIDSTTHKLKRTDSSGVDVTIEAAAGAIATDTIWDAKGDLVAGTGADAAAKVTVGSNNTILMADSAQSTGVKWFSMATSENRLSGDTAMASANTYYDGPSLTLGAGTYILIGKVTVNSGASGGARLTAKLWNGTTVEDSAEASVAATSMATLSVIGIVTLAGSETWKISAATNTVTGGAGAIFAAANANGAGNNASTLIAIQIA